MLTKIRQPDAGARRELEHSSGDADDHRRRRRRRLIWRRTLTEVAQAMKSLDATVKSQATRLEALEKRTGLPNSRPAGERVAKGDADEDARVGRST